jgi:hypothetical protein
LVEVLQSLDCHVEVWQGVLNKFPPGQLLRILLDFASCHLHRSKYDKPSIESCDCLAFHRLSGKELEQMAKKKKH